MPALSVSIDGTLIATVSTEGFNVLDVRIHGTRIDEELATLDLAGGSYPEQGDSTYLSWINQLPLNAGQVVTVSFLESAATSHTGKTIDELYPDEPPLTEADLRVTPERQAELRAKRALREKFCFRLAASSGTRFAGESAPDEHGFSFAVLWLWSEPERATVLLNSYTFDSVEARAPAKYHVREEIHYGDSIQFELIPCMH